MNFALIKSNKPLSNKDNVKALPKNGTNEHKSPVIRRLCNRGVATSTSGCYPSDIGGSASSATIGRNCEATPAAAVKTAIVGPQLSVKEGVLQRYNLLTGSQPNPVPLANSTVSFCSTSSATSGIVSANTTTSNRSQRANTKTTGNNDVRIPIGSPNCSWMPDTVVEDSVDFDINRNGGLGKLNRRHLMHASVSQSSSPASIDDQSSNSPPLNSVGRRRSFNPMFGLGSLFAGNCGPQVTPHHPPPQRKQQQDSVVTSPPSVSSLVLANSAPVQAVAPISGDYRQCYSVYPQPSCISDTQQQQEHQSAFVSSLNRPIRRKSTGVNALLPIGNIGIPMYSPCSPTEFAIYPTPFEIISPILTSRSRDDRMLLSTDDLNNGLNYSASQLRNDEKVERLERKVDELSKLVSWRRDDINVIGSPNDVSTPLRGSLSCPRIQLCPPSTQGDLNLKNVNPQTPIVASSTSYAIANDPKEMEISRLRGKVLRQREKLAALSLAKENDAAIYKAQLESSHRQIETLSAKLNSSMVEAEDIAMQLERSSVSHKASIDEIAKLKEELLSKEAALDEMNWLQFQNDALNFTLDCKEIELGTIRRAPTHESEADKSIDIKLNQLLAEEHLTLRKCSFAIKCIQKTLDAFANNKPISISALTGCKSESMSESENDVASAPKLAYMSKSQIMAQLSANRAQLEQVWRNIESSRGLLEDYYATEIVKKCSGK